MNSKNFKEPRMPFKAIRPTDLVIVIALGKGCTGIWRILGATLIGDARKMQ